MAKTDPGRLSLNSALEEQFRTGSVDYWHVNTNSASDVPGVTHHRATYHRFTRWADHPWSKQIDGQGGDFTDEWAIEVEGPAGWYGTGRAPTDWFSRQIKRSDVFASRAEAIAYAREKTEERLAALLKSVERTRRGLDGLV